MQICNKLAILWQAFTDLYGEVTPFAEVKLRSNDSANGVLNSYDLTILRIEQGTRFVPDYEVVAIADFFNVSCEYLLGVTDEK